MPPRGPNTDHVGRNPLPQPALLVHDLVRTLDGDGRRVLDGVSLTASPGHRIGLIGENGVGKSTLLRLPAGADEPDAGSVTRPPAPGFLRRETPYDTDATVADVLDDALREAGPGEQRNSHWR